MRFNPRTPCGVRRNQQTKTENNNMFQSTHSLRSATQEGRLPSPASNVSIHALLAECDYIIVPRHHPPSRFNPRTPCGVRHRKQSRNRKCRKFQSTHSLRSATIRAIDSMHDALVSIHALLAECDFITASIAAKQSGFNPRTPCGVRLRPTLYIATQQSKSYFAPTSLKRPSLHGCSF